MDNRKKIIIILLLLLLLFLRKKSNKKDSINFPGTSINEIEPKQLLT